MYNFWFFVCLFNILIADKYNEIVFKVIFYVDNLYHQSKKSSKLKKVTYLHSIN